LLSIGTGISLPVYFCLKLQSRGEIVRQSRNRIREFFFSVQEYKALDVLIEVFFKYYFWFQNEKSKSEEQKNKYGTGTR
jgi:hypothetical protein